NQYYPSVAAGPSGFLVMWAGNGHPGEDKTGVYAQRYLVSGATIGGEFHVNTGTTGYTDSQNAAIRRSDGSFVIVWRGDDGDSDGVLGRRFDSSGAFLGPEFVVNTFTTFGEGTPAVAFDTDSSFVVIWRSQFQDGNGSGIYGRRFLFSGEPVSGEFRVNATTSGSQFAPDVASSQTHGRHLVTWTGPDGDKDGIFDQAFCFVGDANSDGKVDVADVFFLINLLFANGPPTVGCVDVNADGAVDVADIFYLINYLFAGGAPPL
ncbi:MAG TPA: dockerin type I repeat-containing protein, partial [Thermoanaerobaculia bacterium]|nr:dockerin type I repeat-containing protein [Thermoanaerobaculia bacterium]